MAYSKAESWQINVKNVLIAINRHSTANTSNFRVYAILDSLSVKLHMFFVQVWNILPSLYFYIFLVSSFEVNDISVPI